MYRDAVVELLGEMRDGVWEMISLIGIVTEIFYEYAILGTGGGE